MALRDLAVQVADGVCAAATHRQLHVRLVAHFVDGVCAVAIDKYQCRIQQRGLVGVEPPPDASDFSNQVQEEAASNEVVQVATVNPESLQVVDAKNEVKVVAFESGMMANLVQAFATEIIASALEIVAARCVPTTTQTRSAAVGSDTGDTQETVPTTDKAGSTRDQAVEQPGRPVSHRQLIHQVAKATNDQVLVAVLQSVIAVAVRQTAEVPASSADPLETPDGEQENQNGLDHSLSSSPSSPAEVKSPPAQIEENTAQLESLPAQIESTEQIPSLNLQQEELNQQPPPVSTSADSDTIRSHVAHAFVHTLLLEATASRPSLKPQISIKPSPTAEQQESPSSGSHNRRKSPNVHKRNLAKKDSATSTLTPAAAPVRPQVQQLPTPVPSPPSTAEVDISNDDVIPAANADDQLEPTTTEQSQTHTKAKSKRDAGRPKHHHSHKTEEKLAASGMSSDGAAAGEDDIEVPTSTPAPTTAAKLSKLPLEDVALFSASTSPLSSARRAQEIYKPRPKNGIEALSTPSPLKKPSVRSHPRRHPHHIQNATVAKETSYLRDSPRADAIAAEMMQKKTNAKATIGASDSLSSHVLLPLTAKAPPIPTAAVQSPVQSPTSTTSSKASREKKPKSSSPTKMRSGYCQQCIFEGQSCKTNDCLKHQLLK